MGVLALMSGQPASDLLIEACRAGDREAFRQLFETYKDRVYTIALRYSGDPSAAKDITQTVFLKLMTRLHQFRRESDFATWLHRLVVNTCVDDYRRGRHFMQFPEKGNLWPQEAPPSQEDRLIRQSTAQAVQAALASIPPKMRLAVLLKYFEDLSYEEIAEALGCSKGTVASRLNRAHRHLARKLGHLRGAFAPGGVQ